jgi:hypothetical protein
MDMMERVQFAVEASDYESLRLWQEFHPKAKSWEQEMRGTMITVGHINDRPICVQLSWNMINDKRVLFYSASSQLVDWVLIEKWLKANALTPGHTMTDASNFHLIFDQLQ